MTFDRRIEPCPHPPRGTGLLGEVNAMHSIVTAAGARVSAAMLLGVSGLAFAYGFRVRTDSRGELPQFGWFRPSQLDGPAPLRLAARYAGFDYTPHLINSTSTMFERVVKSIEAGLCVLSHDPRPPHVPAILFGYRADNDALQPPHAFHMISAIAHESEGDPQPVVVHLPRDPEGVVFEMGPWRNPVGVVQRSRQPMDDDRRGREIRSALRRAAATSQTSVIAAPDEDEEMADGDVLDDGVRDHMVKPSFDSWAHTVLGKQLDLDALRTALNDLTHARRAAADYLRISAPLSGWETEPVADHYDRVADGLSACAAMIPADATTLDDTTRDAMAARLHETHDVETGAMNALRAAFQ